MGGWKAEYEATLPPDADTPSCPFWDWIEAERRFVPVFLAPELATQLTGGLAFSGVIRLERNDDGTGTLIFDGSEG
jgi:hypothetical protein